VKNSIEADQSNDNGACASDGKCVQIKKTRNSIIWLAAVIVVLAYLFLIPGALLLLYILTRNL